MTKITITGAYASPIGPNGENAPQRGLAIMVIESQANKPGGCKVVYGAVADEGGQGSISVEVQ